MPKTVFRSLRKQTKSWWYHAKLRKQGDLKEARKREHVSLRSRVKHWRDALENNGHLDVYHDRFVLTISRYETLSGYDPTDMLFIAKALGVRFTIH